MTKQEATKLGRAADTIVGAMAREKLTLPALAGKAIDVLESRDTAKGKLFAMGLSQKCRSFADIARKAAALMGAPLAFNRARHPAPIKPAPARPAAKPAAKPSVSALRSALKNGFITEQEIPLLVELTPEELKELLTTDDSARIAELLKRKKAALAAARRTASARKVAPAKAAAKPLEREATADRLLAAQKVWSETLTEAHRLSRTSSRNLTGAELRFIKAARQLPRFAPNAGSTLREWRHFAALVEKTMPAIAAARRI